MDTLEALKLIADSVFTKPDQRPIEIQNLQEGERDSALYYRFLFEVARMLRPKASVETGTWHAISAAQIAGGSPEGTVITFDVDPESRRRAEATGLRNIIALTGDSAGPEALRAVKERFPALDLLFLDSEHRYDVVSREFGNFSPLVRPGGIVLLDDIHLNPDMRRFWFEIRQPKVDLSRLHTVNGAGFGALVV